jgi:tRNA(adenine34) deaminase
MTDSEIMKEALIEAHKAYERGECPVGAVLVHEGKIIARAGNEEKELHDPSAHAEILVLRKAGQVLGKHTFPDCTVYTTLWPCPMCQGVLMRAKVKNIICGARSYKWIYEKDFDKSNLTKHGPIMEEECRDIYIQWLKGKGLTNILESGTMEE